MHRGNRHAIGSCLAPWVRLPLPGNSRPRLIPIHHHHSLHPHSLHTSSSMILGSTSMTQHLHLDLPIIHFELSMLMVQDLSATLNRVQVDNVKTELLRTFGMSLTTFSELSGSVVERIQQEATRCTVQQAQAVQNAHHHLFCWACASCW